MLQLNFIKENKDLTIAGLERKYFKNAAETVEQVLSLDQNRKDMQLELDNTLAQANNLAKDIGGLMKEGKKDEAEAIKGKTAELKAASKNLEEKLKELEVSLQDVLITMPNLPHESVPAGRTPEENLNIFSLGDIPKLHAEAQPHWELIKK